MIKPEAWNDWVEDCLKWRGKVLNGKYAHWCYDWDGLPVDETCGEEFDCCYCFEEPKIRDLT